MFQRLQTKKISQTVCKDTNANCSSNIYETDTGLAPFLSNTTTDYAYAPSLLSPESTVARFIAFVVTCYSVMETDNKGLCAVCVL